MTSLTSVGVFGGGRMGAGIAHAFLVTGRRVTIVEADDAAAEGARERVAGSVARAHERGSLLEVPNEALDRLTVSSTVETLADCELVVEAVPEDPALKSDVLRRIEEAAPRAVIATNTSSLSIDDLATSLSHPDRFLGLHFFNPVPVSELVEIVAGSQTPAALLDDARSWVASLDKTAIVVTDSPGFASSRLGVAIALEAMRMLEAGVASAEDIDTAMTLGYKHPVGPLRTTDLVGLDVRLAIAEHLAHEVGERFAPPQILRDKVAAGDLGRKTGQGFYVW